MAGAARAGAANSFENDAMLGGEQPPSAGEFASELGNPRRVGPGHLRYVLSAWRWRRTCAGWHPSVVYEINTHQLFCLRGQRDRLMARPQDRRAGCWGREQSIHATQSRVPDRSTIIDKNRFDNRLVV
jgi:hypothetical protein